MNSERRQMTLMISMLAVLSVIFSSTAFAYQTYDGCKDCHGGFRDNPYISLSDGSDWGDDLHDVHRTTMLDGDCSTCHGSSKSPVSLDTSTGGSGLAAISCVGCHGREADMGNDNISGGWGAGLRQHHTNAGETDCMGCHDDADPNLYTPVGEDVLPNYYANPGTGHPNIPTDSCNLAGEENFAGTTLGLDNDGDGSYDTNDSNCQSNTPPTQPGTLSASLVTTSSATVSWGASTDADDDDITYRVEYRRSGDTPWTSGGSTTGTSRPLSGLDGNQSYDVRVTPNDGTADGTSRTALNLFKTDNTLPTQPGTLSASAVTTNSATVSWGASTDVDGDTITYKVEYRHNGATLWTSGGSITGTSRPLSGLDGNQSYDVRVTPNDGTADGTSRTALNLFKTDNTPPTQPGTLSALAVTTSSATINWGVSTDADGDDITYRVEYRRSGDTPWTSGGSTTGTSRPLSGLDGNQSYDVRVTPNDGTADGTSRTALNLFKTDNTLPTQPGTLSASAVTTNSATINWGVSTDADGDDITYRVEYRHNGATLWTIGGSTTGTSQALTGLDSSQSYDVRVTPNDGTEDGLSRDASDLFQTAFDTDAVFKDSFEGN